jgi:curved DNA-binding protein CbpA
VTFQGDPYRVLGVTPGASLNEIRSAYRRLAKKYHPDTAGERALTRFLAIQAAYEQLVDADGRLRPARAPGNPGRPAPGREPWRADPARARASREAWRARRAGRGAAEGASSGAAGTTSGAGDRADHGTGSRYGTGSGHGTGTQGGAWSRPAGDARSGARASGGHDAGQTPRRGSRKATPGSTTYDEAADGGRDPEWDGGAWYGPSLHTYWTINPREYADPRKHGPEYQERARRATGWSGADATGARPAPSTTDADADTPGGWGSGSWTYRSDAGHGGEASDSARPATGSRRRSPGYARAGAPTDGGAGAPTDGRAGTQAGEHARPGTGDHARPGMDERARAGGSTAWPGTAQDVAPLPDLESLARQAAPRHLLALARDRQRRWRWLFALIGWPPIGWAVGTLLTTVTGCAGFSATCPAPVPALSLLIQPFIVAGLVLVPPLAALAAFGAIAALAAAVPLAAVLAVGTSPDSSVGAAVLGVLVSAAYLVALVLGGYSLWRAPPDPEVLGPASR